MCACCTRNKHQTFIDNTNIRPCVLESHRVFLRLGRHRRFPVTVRIFRRRRRRLLLLRLGQLARLLTPLHCSLLRHAGGDGIDQGVDLLNTSNCKIMAIFQYKIIIYQGQFYSLSAFSMENSKQSWHIYCNPYRR